MKKTNNLQLGLWEGSDFPNIMIPNNNMEILDSTYGTLKTKVEGYDDEITEINTDLTSVKSRVTENEQSIELLDDFDTEVRDNLFTFTGGTDTKYRIKKFYNIQRVLNCTVTNTSNLIIPQTSVEYESPGRVTCTVFDSSDGVHALRGFDVNGSVDITSIIGDIDTTTEGIVVLSAVCARSPISNGTKHLIPQFYGLQHQGKSTLLHFNIHEKFNDSMTMDSSNNPVYGFSENDFNSTFVIQCVVGVFNKSDIIE